MHTPTGNGRTGALDSSEDLYAVCQDAVEGSHELGAEVIKWRVLDGPASFSWPHGRIPAARAMLLDMTEEYARQR